MTVYEKGLITVLACSAVFAVVSIPLILRKVPPNPVYGYRTKAILRDEALWYEVNAYFGVRFLIADVVSACIAVALFLWGGLSPHAFMNATIVLLAAPVAVAGVLTSRFVRRMPLASGTANQRR